MNSGRISGSSLSRRRFVSGTVAGAAAVAASSNRLVALAQDATPQAAACAEGFESGLLSTVNMVTDGSPITVAIVPKGVHPFFEDTRIGAERRPHHSG